MAATTLSIPATAPAYADRWALIDQTCQVLFAGEGGGRIVFVFQTSTGEPGFGTRNQEGSRAFRFNPARANDGWHNSFDYPAAGDNPLNGNMYMPVYFDGGQAIHGANNVPTEPRSKGCARIGRIRNQGLSRSIRAERRPDCSRHNHEPQCWAGRNDTSRSRRSMSTVFARVRRRSIFGRAWAKRGDGVVSNRDLRG